MRLLRIIGLRMGSFLRRLFTTVHEKVWLTRASLPNFRGRNAFQLASLLCTLPEPSLSSWWLGSGVQTPALLHLEVTRSAGPDVAVDGLAW